MGAALHSRKFHLTIKCYETAPGSDEKKKETVPGRTHQTCDSSPILCVQVPNIWNFEMVMDPDYLLVKIMVFLIHDYFY